MVETVFDSSRLRVQNYYNWSGKETALGPLEVRDGCYYWPSEVMFFEPEREPSQDGMLVETEALSRIAEPSEHEGPKPALCSRSVLVYSSSLGGNTNWTCRLAPRLHMQVPGRTHRMTLSGLCSMHKARLYINYCLHCIVVVELMCLLMKC
jgi:hypothetical protein